MVHGIEMILATVRYNGKSDLLMLSVIANNTVCTSNIEAAATVIQQGGVVAYPTESCFGLGCDPENITAIKRILKIKKRKREKGVILIADRFERFNIYIHPLEDKILETIKGSWPGPNTWLCPAKSSCSPWLKGGYANLAIRVTAHTPAAKLAQKSNCALVSTSANVSSKPALTQSQSVVKEFDGLVDLVLDLPIGGDLNPSTIRNATTGEVIR